MNKSKIITAFILIALYVLNVGMLIFSSVTLSIILNNAMKMKKNEKKIFEVFEDSEIHIKKGYTCFYAEMDAYLTEANETRLVKLVSSPPPYDYMCAISGKDDLLNRMLLIKYNGHHTAKISPDDGNVGYAFNWNWKVCIIVIPLLGLCAVYLLWFVIIKIPEELRGENQHTRLENEEMNELVGQN